MSITEQIDQLDLLLRIYHEGGKPMKIAHWRGYDVEILGEEGDLTIIRYSPNRYIYFNEWVKTSELR